MSEIENELKKIQYNNWNNFLKTLLKKDGILYKNKPKIDKQTTLDDKDKVEFYEIKLTWFFKDSIGIKCDDIRLELIFDVKEKIISIEDMTIFDNYTEEDVYILQDSFEYCIKEFKQLFKHYLSTFKFKDIDY